VSREEVRQCMEEIPTAVTTAIRILAEDYGDETNTIGAISDFAWDQIETTCYLEIGWEELEVEAAIQREVFSRFGLGSYESDATEVKLSEAGK